MSDLNIALSGNPNCGKTTLFNALTGSRQHVGNWPGVTVDKKEGKFKFAGTNVNVIDLPGTYGLGAYSEDEVVARNYIIEEKPDVVINVVDATNIERNLYLTTQLLETNSNVVIALNMMDEAKAKEIEIDMKRLEKLLNVPIVPICAIKNEGIDLLVKKAVAKASERNEKPFAIDYGDEINNAISRLSDSLKNKCDYNEKWIVTRMFEGDEYITKKIKDMSVIDSVKSKISELNKSIGYEVDIAIIDKRYEFIGDVVSNSVKRKEVTRESASEKIDKIVTNKFLGLPIFAIIMFFIYQVTMLFGNEFLGGYVDGAFSKLAEVTGGFLANVGASELLTSFIVDGIIGGVGSVFVFFPLLLTLYFFISLLEDSGYMARAAYVMDKFMSLIGLHGKTAVSLIISSGCNVAGIMSTRTLESKKDRMIAILINPFISCSARMPVYALFIGAFFADQKIGMFSASGLILFGLYAFGILMAVIVGKIFSETLFKGDSSYFIMELPPYRIPTLKSVSIHMWEKSSAFIKKAGTLIFTIVVAVWVLSNLPFGVEPGTADSLLGKIGGVIAPIFAPCGFGTWQAGVALVTGIGAKEAVVATFGVIYGVGEGAGLLTAISQAFTPLSAISFMIMTLLYVPCAAAIGATKRETNSIKWTIFSVVYTTAVAWGCATLVYQIGLLLGFN